MTVLRGSVRVGAELLVTLGLVVVAFAVYLLFWSDVQNAAAQDDLRSTFDAQVAQASRVKGSDQGVQQVTAPATGAALGVLTIPRLGSDWSRVMVEGVESEELALGPGHFPGTAMPGQVGNFAVAGHRATNGEPFAHLDTLEPGDKVVVETVNQRFTYVVDGTVIVAPTSTDVLEPVPGKPGANPKHARLTLVTCNPRWGSTERMIVSGHLVSTDVTTGA